MRNRGRKKSSKKPTRAKKVDVATKRRAELTAAAKAYFDGLAKKDLSRVPWADNATLRAPLNPNGGAAVPIVGKANILAFLNPLLPNLGKIEVLRHCVEGNWVCTRANVGLAGNPAAVLRVVDSFRVEKGRIVEQENHYDPRPALAPA